MAMAAASISWWVFGGGTILSPKSKPTLFTSEDIGPQSRNCAQQSTFRDNNEPANLL
ncbi:hypothetical protein CUJ84_pRLN3000460 (plasmid) [Rhizobium leguminosarum]|uniref:Uncharacterized protein n=1 Tax=Rhizobium leguminosarum TaxID=384 RepID=A0A2K9ZH40_RHILE|nr:hypothetical protein CUJ84_pRLN3000460 [Rhizobium leguminosarum]